MGIKVENLKKYYTNGEVVTRALDDVTVEIKTGELVCILGPSGSGKSTFLNVISGLDSADDGVISIDNEIISGYNEKELVDFRRKKLGFIFQQYNLLPHLNVRENIEVGAYLSKDPLDIDEVIKLLGLENETLKYPSQISGGQQQRVSIGRALSKNPSILFCDEPTGALDENTGKDVLQLIQNLNEEFNKTVVIVTHNPNLVRMSDLVIKMGSGKITEIIRPETKERAVDIDWS